MLHDIVAKARSIRSFDMSKPVDRELLVSFVDTLRLIPASCNYQALKYLIITDKAECDYMRSQTRWAALLPDYNGPDSEHSPTAYMVICHDTSITENETMYLKDVGIAAQTLNLLAREKEIGCCMIGSFNIGAVSEYFCLPESIKPKLTLALGYPDEFPVCEDETGSVAYYRDENNIHHVPKRKTKDLIINN